MGDEFRRARSTQVADVALPLIQCKVIREILPRREHDFPLYILLHLFDYGKV